jgi:hypothetical protein
MYRAVKAQEGNHYRIKSNHERDSVGRPTTIVGEFGEDRLGVAFWCQNQEGNHDSEQARNVEYQYHAFHQRQLLGQEGIEEDGKTTNANHNQRSVPGLWLISRHIQDHQALQASPHQKRG